MYNSFIHPHLYYGSETNMVRTYEASNINASLCYRKKIYKGLLRFDSHSTSDFLEIILKIYYKNANNLLAAYFRGFTPNYNIDIDHNHDLMYNV